MRAVVADSHVLHWWSAEPARVSRRAARLLTGADEVVVSAITWFELAWLARNGRVVVGVPVRTWLARLQQDVRTAPITTSIAATAADLPASFPGDPADRLIWATAIELGLELVTKDRRMLDHPAPRRVAVW